MGYVLVFLIPFCVGVVAGYIIPSGSFIKAFNQKGLGSSRNSRIIQKYPEIETESTAEQNMGIIKKRAVELATIKPEEIYENEEQKDKAIDVRSFVSLHKKFRFKEKAIHSLLNEQFSNGYDFKRGYHKPSLTDNTLWKPTVPTQIFLTKEELKLLRNYRNPNNDATPHSIWRKDGIERIRAKKNEVEAWLRKESPEFLMECRHTVPKSLPQKPDNSQNKFARFAKGLGKPGCKCNGQKKTHSLGG